MDDALSGASILDSPCDRPDSTWVEVAATPDGIWVSCRSGLAPHLDGVALKAGAPLARSTGAPLEPADLEPMVALWDRGRQGAWRVSHQSGLLDWYTVGDATRLVQSGVGRMAVWSSGDPWLELSPLPPYPEARELAYVLPFRKGWVAVGNRGGAYGAQAVFLRYWDGAAWTLWSFPSTLGVQLRGVVVHDDEIVALFDTEAGGSLTAWTPEGGFGATRTFEFPPSAQTRLWACGDALWLVQYDPEKQEIALRRPDVDPLGVSAVLANGGARLGPTACDERDRLYLALFDGSARVIRTDRRGLSQVAEIDQRDRIERSDDDRYGMAIDRDTIYLVINDAILTTPVRRPRPVKQAPAE